jgi:hypothetical protein
MGQGREDGWDDGLNYEKGRDHHRNVEEFIEGQKDSPLRGGLNV